MDEDQCCGAGAVKYLKSKAKHVKLREFFQNFTFTATKS